jgi:hypothetical protein
VVEEEEDEEDGAERERDADAAPVELPEADEPRARARGLERAADGERQRVRGVEPAPVCGGGGADERGGHAVVGEQAAHVPVAHVRARERGQQRRGADHEEREDDGHERARVLLRGRVGRRGELSGDDLDAVLEVDPGDVEAERVAREEGHMPQEVAPCAE